MKKIQLFFTLLFVCQYSLANDAYPEATAAVLNELTRQQLDSHQLEVGGSVFYRQSNIVPSINIKSTLFFNKKYHFGASFNATPEQNNHQGLIIYTGINAGFRSFNLQLGKFYVDLLLGYGAGDNIERVIIEPSIIFPITESRTTKYYWLRHKFGINAAIAYRHTLDPNNLQHFEDTNVIKLYLSFFIHQKMK